MNKPAPRITFYQVQTPDGCVPFHDRQRLFDFLHSEGAADMTVSANGEDVTPSIARELAKHLAIGGEYSVGYADMFGEFCLHHAERTCGDMWAEIERDHNEYLDEMELTAWGKWA